MKLVKMSLAAAVLMGASAYAIDNVKVNGDAKLYYGTNDNWGVGSYNLFDQGSSYADAALRVGVSGDLTKGVSFGLTANAVSTLGLENNLVSNTWTGAHPEVQSGDKGVDDAMWMSEVWLAATMGKTTVKAGRMELDTPFAFSEKGNRSIVTNTFEAAVVLNQDIPNTTLVGAWVGKGNGVTAGDHGSLFGYDNNNHDVGMDGMGTSGFQTFAASGAYAAGIVNNSFKPLVAQGWYYNVLNVADAYWLQADWDCQLIKDVKVGVQYADLSPKGLLSGAQDSKAYAFKLGYEGIQNLKVSAAYSKTDKDGVLSIANVATDNTYNAQSKLYTETFWTYGLVGSPDAKTWNFSADYDAGFAALGAQYTDISTGDAQHAYYGYSNTDVEEFALTATKSFGPLNARLAYINTDWTEPGGSWDENTINVYLTLNF